MILVGHERERKIEIENKNICMCVRERGLCATAAYISLVVFLFHPRQGTKFEQYKKELSAHTLKCLETHTIKSPGEKRVNESFQKS